MLRGVDLKGYGSGSRALFVGFRVGTSPKLPGRGM